VLKRTSAEEIRREIAARIIAGRLAPGTALDETQIAAEFAVSRTPVREALRLLGASGLIEQRPHARALVAEPSEEKLRGMFEIMGELEALCAGRAAVAMDGTERAALDSLHEQMAALVRAGDAAGYAEANDAFHGMIYDGSHNDYLAEITR
jgi:DNA-binding GntR family transcriptional regulator